MDLSVAQVAETFCKYPVDCIIDYVYNVTWSVKSVIV